MSKASFQQNATLTLIAALVLCAPLSGRLLSAQRIPEKAVLTKSRSAILDPEQRTFHLLNRFTFGPTSYEVASMRDLASTKNSRSAIDKWFEQQLHPDSLPATSGDQELATRLAEFPAMQLPVGQLLDRFPNSGEIRQIVNGKRRIPTDPTLALIYRHQIGVYEENQAKKEELRAKEQLTIPSTTLPASIGVSSMATNGTSLALNQPTDADMLVKAILTLSPTDRINRILTMQPDEYELLHSALKDPQKQQLIRDLNPPQRELIADFDNPTRTIVEELQTQRLLRDIFSSHQLQEMMITFWLNHFNIYLHKNEEMPYYLVSYERDVLRPRALGNFEDLLIATAESPAMLLYLDSSTSTGPNSVIAEKQRVALNKNSKSTPPGLNENFARELMELHTLGVDGGYTQKDVSEVARIFTGWTVDHPGQGGEFFFDETRHDPGTKLVLGHKIKENGQKEGLELLHILANNPATAHFVSQKMAIAFVSDIPPPSLVNRMARSFLQTHGDIGSVLLSMVHSPEFWSSQAYQAKVKTPLEYVISAVRVGGADITNTQPLVNALNQMGMPLYACVPPTGYAAKADAWVSTGALVTRMNFGLLLGANHLSGIHSNWSAPPPSSQQLTEALDSGVAEQRLEAQLIPTGIGLNTRTAILSQAQTQAPSPVKAASNLLASANSPNPKAADRKATAQTITMEKRDALLAGLLLGSPEFQRR